MGLSVLGSFSGCAEISSLCLQAEGGKRAGAVATVVAAVDLARVRLPLADEEEAAEGEVRQQAKEITTEKRVVETKTLGAEPPPAVSVTSDQQIRVQVSQVRNLLDSCWTSYLSQQLFSFAQ